MTPDPELPATLKEKRQGRVLGGYLKFLEFETTENSSTQSEPAYLTTDHNLKFPMLCKYVNMDTLTISLLSRGVSYIISFGNRETDAGWTHYTNNPITYYNLVKLRASLVALTIRSHQELDRPPIPVQTLFHELTSAIRYVAKKRDMPRPSTPEALEDDLTELEELLNRSDETNEDLRGQINEGLLNPSNVFEPSDQINQELLTRSDGFEPSDQTNVREQTNEELLSRSDGLEPSDRTTEDIRGQANEEGLSHKFDRADLELKVREVDAEG